MTGEEKLGKLIKKFSELPEAKQDYILGILQSLAFAHDVKNEEPIPPDLEQNSEPV